MRNTDRWRKLIFELSDQAFFDLVRNYLGNIHTPFNKHTLLDDLEHFLISRKDQIFSMIDASDAALLSAIDFMENASVDQLYTLFKTEVPYYSFYTHLLNLEERMLICPTKETGKHGVVISPLFKDELEKQIIDFDLFIGARKAQPKKNSRYAWYDAPAVGAVLSYLLASYDIMRSDLSFKKKAEEEVASRVGAVNGNAVKDVLLGGSLLTLDRRRLVPDMDKIRTLFSKDIGSFKSFFIRAYLSSDPSAASLYANMRTDRVYPDAAFARLAQCISALSGRQPGDVSAYKKIFLQSGLVVEDSAGLQKLVDDLSPADGRIVVQPDFSLIVQGRLTVDEHMMLAFYSEIREFDVVQCYEITRESFMRGMRSGISADNFTDMLTSRSDSPLPQNILFSLKSWEEECHGIEIYRGCVIKVDSRYSKLLDNNKYFKRYIEKKIADGIYLVSDDKYILAKHELESVSGQRLDLPLDKKRPEALKEPPYMYDTTKLLSYSEPVASDHRQDVSGRLLKKLDTLNIPSEQRDILADRIKRKLILSEKQLEDGEVRYELMEARGIDYSRKVRLCQHVLETGNSFLELSVGSEETLLVKPLQLKKEGNDLLLSADTIPEGKSVQVLLRKVRYMRKVRTSLMG